MCSGNTDEGNVTCTGRRPSDSINTQEMLMEVIMYLLECVHK